MSIGLGVIFIGPIVIRIYLELVMDIFKVFDNLKEINDKLENKNRS